MIKADGVLGAWMRSHVDNEQSQHWKQMYIPHEGDLVVAVNGRRGADLMHELKTCLKIKL